MVSEYTEYEFVESVGRLLGSIGVSVPILFLQKQKVRVGVLLCCVLMINDVCGSARMFSTVFLLPVDFSIASENLCEQFMELCSLIEGPAERLRCCVVNYYL